MSELTRSGTAPSNVANLLEQYSRVNFVCNHMLFLAQISVQINSVGPMVATALVATVGDVYLRTLLIHGAGAVVSQAKHKDDRLSRWVTSIALRRHPNVAAAALANKTARMAWAMLRNETDYDPDFAMR